MARKRKLSKFSLAIDMGGSLTKAVTTNDRGEHCFFAIAPEITTVSQEMLDRYQSQSFLDEKIDWIAYDNSEFSGDLLHEGRKFVFGKTARNIFDAHNNLKKLKSDSGVGIPKVLAVIYLLCQHYGVNKIDLNLGILLPSAEFISGSKDIFLQNLTSVLNSFDSELGKIEVTLSQPILIYPEGAGAYLTYAQTLGNTVKDKNLGVVTLGYRNMNFFLSSQGRIGNYKGNYLGFNFIVRSVAEYLGMTNSGHLATAIFESGVDVKMPPLETFLNYYQNNAQIDLSHLRTYILDLVGDYTNKIRAWFEICFEFYPEQIIFLGGSLDYLKPILPKLFPSHVKLVCNPGYQPPSSLIDKNSMVTDIRGLNLLEARFIDVFSTFLLLADRDESFRYLINPFISGEKISHAKV